MLWSCARRLLVGTAASAAAVALVTGAVYALDPIAPILGLGVLYLLAVVPVAAIWGLRFAIGVSVVGMLVFNWLFLPPTHTFHLAESEDWVALAVYLVVAVSVSALAARARAAQPKRSSSVARPPSPPTFPVSSSERRRVESQLPEIAVRTADLLGVSHCWIELGAPREPDPDETSRDLVAGGRHGRPDLLRRRTLSRTRR